MADDATRNIEASDSESEDESPSILTGTSAAKSAKNKKKKDRKKAKKGKVLHVPHLRAYAACPYAFAPFELFVAASGGATSAATAEAEAPVKDKAAAVSTAAAPSTGLADVAPEAVTRGGEPSKLPLARGVTGFTDYYLKHGQTEPPTIPVSQLFPSRKFPEGQVMEYASDFNSWRTTSEEKRYAERLNADLYETVREAAEVHRQVRAYAQSIIKPGIKLADMCEKIENMNRHLVKENGIQRGIAFPTGECSSLPLLSSPSHALTAFASRSPCRLLIEPCCCTLHAQSW
jgi:methionyl aminopeptidase